MRVTSNTEREFVTSIISIGKRLDGRSLKDSRTLKIEFLNEWGGCIVYLGNTAVLSQVTAEVTEPKASSPTEGALHVNFELSPMSAPDVNLSRSSNEFVELQRSLERCIRDSKCIDLESLCIVAGVKVWTITVNIRAMNDDGNVLECGSIAAISALAHFKRPDVTVIGTEVTVHSLDEREPVPLSLHHMPIAINIAFFCQGTRIVLDPTELEERVADGFYIIGMNNNKEIFMIHRRGSLLLSEDTIQKCVELATCRVQSVTRTIKKLQQQAVKLESLTKRIATSAPYYSFLFSPANRSVPVIDSGTLAVKEIALRILKQQEACLFEGGTSKWAVESEEDESSSDENRELHQETPSAPVLKQESDSSEEETSFLESDEVDVKPSSSRSWYLKNPLA